MITRYQESPRALETAIASAREGQTVTAVLVYHRDINSVHVASIVVRVRVRWIGDLLEVEVGMPNRAGNPFQVQAAAQTLLELVEYTNAEIDRIVSA